MLKFNSLLIEAGIDPSKVRLVRHRHERKYQRLVYQDALNRNPRFDDYQAGQDNPTVIEQMSSADALVSFVVDPTGDTVFVGLWRVSGQQPGFIPDPYCNPQNQPIASSCVIALQRMDTLSDYCGRIIIDWGGGERAWVQYADRRDKQIVEVRRRAEEPQFPGFARFGCALHEVDSLPATWHEALRATRGVYLLIHRSSGAQYVGSATGGDGFLGRWRGYSDGHGGNIALRELAYPADDYDVRILETAGSGATVEDVCDLESRWKDKLGSRVQGLNRN